MEVYAIVDKYNNKKQDYDQVYWKDSDLKKTQKHFKKMGNKYGDIQLIKVDTNGKMIQLEAIDYANDENEAVGNFLLNHRDGKKILSAVMNSRYPKARDLEKLVIKYHKTRGIPNWEFEDDDDGGIDWVTFSDLLDNLMKNESFTNEKKGEFLSSLFPKVKVDKAIKIAKKMKGNMTGAVKAIEKFFPGMSKHNDVQDALRQYNESVNEQQKRQASDIQKKYDKAHLKFAREVRDIIQMINRYQGDKTDGKIIDKEYSKHLIPFNQVIQSWTDGQYRNPNLSESVNESRANVKKAIAIAKKMGGNMSGAVKKIEKIQKGLSKQIEVEDALKTANESINERFRPSDRKVLLVIGRDVVKILNDKYHKGTLTPNKQLGQALNSIFRAMTRDESDANYKQYKKYFPKYNAKLLRRLTKAYFDEPVNVQNTFIKHVMKYALGDSK